jgi:hypothetical protein
LISGIFEARVIERWRLVLWADVAGVEAARDVPVRLVAGPLKQWCQEVVGVEGVEEGKRIGADGEAVVIVVVAVETVTRSPSPRRSLTRSLKHF